MILGLGSMSDLFDFSAVYLFIYLLGSHKHDSECSLMQLVVWLPVVNTSGTLGMGYLVDQLPADPLLVLLHATVPSIFSYFVVV